MSHTPGPWEVSIDIASAGQRATIMHRTGVVAITSFSTNTTLIEANARLIAAAPDLLEACECFLIASKGTFKFLEATEKARKAIAKAKEATWR